MFCAGPAQQVMVAERDCTEPQYGGPLIEGQGTGSFFAVMSDSAFL